MRRLLILLPLLLSSITALAQSDSAAPSSAVLQSCLLGTSPEQWAMLKLSQDQIRRISHIQEACREECEGAGVVVVPNPVAEGGGDMIMDDVRMVLSREQYTEWVAYCVASGRGEK